MLAKNSESYKYSYLSRNGQIYINYKNLDFLANYLTIMTDGDISKINDVNVSEHEIQTYWNLKQDKYDEFKVHIEQFLFSHEVAHVKNSDFQLFDLAYSVFSEHEDYRFVDSTIAFQIWNDVRDYFINTELSKDHFIPNIFINSKKQLISKYKKWIDVPFSEFDIIWESDIKLFAFLMSHLIVPNNSNQSEKLRKDINNIYCDVEEHLVNYNVLMDNVLNLAKEIVDSNRNSWIYNKVRGAMNRKNRKILPFTRKSVAGHRNNVVIAIDYSSSIGQNLFQIAKQFGENVYSKLNGHSNYIRFMFFGKNVSPEYEISDINNVEYKNENYTSFDWVDDYMNRNMIIVTDGNPTFGRKYIPIYKNHYYLIHGSNMGITSNFNGDLEHLFFVGHDNG